MTQSYQWYKTDRPDAVDNVEQTTLSEFRDVLSQWFGEIRRMLVRDAIRPEIRYRVAPGIEDALSDYLAAWKLVFEAMWKDGAQAGREAAIRQHGFDISFEITRPEVEEALEENAERAGDQVQNRMTGDIKETILDAHDRGLGVEEIARLLRDDVFPGMKQWQARRVAQTEVISASNKGNLTAYQDASGVIGKKWIATDDSRTRPTHNHADNQVVRLGQSFTVGGYSADYPGDPDLPPQERINCRCAVSPVIDM